MKAKKVLPGKWPALETEGNVAVRIYRIEKKDGQVFYQVADYSSGRRVLKSFVSFPEAKQHAKEIAQAQARGEAAVLTLSGKDKLAYLRAVELLRPTKTAIEVAAGIYAKAVEILGGDYVVEAARLHAKQNPANLIPRSVHEVCQEFLEAKATAGMSPRYLSDLRYRLGRLAADFQCPITSLTADRIQTWLAANKFGPQSFINFLRVIGTMTAYAKRRRYLPSGWDELERVEKPKVRRGRIDVFTPLEIERLLGAARPEFLPALAIGAFAGLRSSEIERLDWAEIHLPERFIEVHPSKAKTASRRIVPIAENLAGWLTPYMKTDGSVWAHGHDAFYTEQIATAGAAGVQWKANALRHSFISYRLAIIQDAARTALEAGNSPAMIFAHYHQLVRPDTAKQWFGVRPTNADNIVTFTTPLPQEVSL